MVAKRGKERKKYFFSVSTDAPLSLDQLEPRSFYTENVVDYVFWNAQMPCISTLQSILFILKQTYHRLSSLLKTLNDINFGLFIMCVKP